MHWTDTKFRDGVTHYTLCYTELFVVKVVGTERFGYRWRIDRIDKGGLIDRSEEKIASALEAKHAAVVAAVKLLQGIMADLKTGALDV